MGNYAGGADGEQLESQLEGGGEVLPVVRQASSPPLSGSAAYLREVLASEESLRAAFEPVLRAARCPAGDAVDRDAFARAVDRIVGYFNPSEPIGMRGPSFGPPYTVDEALGHFRVVLSQLATRLEELERPASRPRRPSSSLELLAGATSTAGGEVPPLFSEDRGPPSPCRGAVWRSWQPTGTQLPLSSGDVSRQSPLRLASCSPGRRARAASPPSSGGLAEATVGSLPWTSLRPPQAPAPAQVPGTAGSNEPLEVALEASRARVAGLRRALGREEELLRHQAEETRRLEHLQWDLEAEAEAAARRRALAAAARTAGRANQGAVDSSRCEAPPAASWQPPQGQQPAPPQPEKEARALGQEGRPPGSGGGGAAEDEAAAADAALEGPMSLEDVKYHLRTVLRLRRRVVELEGALDGREEQVAVLSDELQRRTASLAMRAAA